MWGSIQNAGVTPCAEGRCLRTEPPRRPLPIFYSVCVCVCVCVCLFWFVWVSCVFWILASSHTYDLQIFFLIESSAFLSFWWFLWLCGRFPFDVVPLVYFCICCVCIWCPIQRIFAKTKAEKFSTCLSLEFYGFRSYVQVTHPLTIFVFGVRKWSSSFLLHLVSSFPVTVPWRDGPLPMAYLLLLFRKLVSSRCGLVSELNYSVPLTCVCVCVPVPYCFDDYGFVI